LLQAPADRQAPVLAELARLDDPSFRAIFRGSPVKRIGRERFLRNVAIALGNSADPAAPVAIEALLGDPSPLVRGAAVWALKQRNADEFARRRPLALAQEIDPSVIAEWS
jgi:epoxyqueuosine reductase